MLVRQIDFTLAAERIVLPRHRQLFDFQVRRFQIQFRAQVVDCCLKKCERGPVNHQMSAKLAVASVHCSVNRDFAREIAGVRAKQSGEITQLIDRRGNVASKIRAEPAGRTRGECSFTAQSELVCPLSYVKLLELNPSVVERSADHDRFGCAIAPRKASQFTPKRRGHPVWLGKISAKSEVPSVEQTANAIGESECLGRLFEGNIGSTAGNFPVRLLRAPL